MPNLAKFTDSFYEFERENNLFDKTIDDIFFWILIRDRIHDNILINKEFIAQKSQTVPSKLSRKVKCLSKYLFNAFVNKLKPYVKVDNLIINHPRKVNLNGKYEDIYTQWLIDLFKSTNNSYLVMDSPLNWGEHLIKKDKNTRNLENFTIIKKVYYKFFAKNNLINNDVLKNISNNLIKHYGNDGNLFDTCFQQLNIFKADYSYYMKLLKKIQPKKIYYVVINSNYALIAAAKKSKIIIEEIQHGLMCRYHLSYSFPYNNHIEYFPDRFCLFGKYWKEITPLPLESDKIDYYANTIRKHEPKEYIHKKNNKIMFIMQLSISDKLIEFISKIFSLKDFDKFEFIIKLHPSEFHVWKELYPILNEFSRKKNVTLIDNFDVSIYDLFKKVDSVIGVASTALFEALYFGCDVYLANVDGVDWVRPLMDERISTFIDDPNLTLEMVNKHKERKINIDDIFCQCNIIKI